MSIQPSLWISVTLLFCSLTVLLAGFRPLPPAGRRCRQCGYRLDGVEDAARCSECGASTRFAIDGETKAPTRHRRLLRRIGFLGVFLAFLGILGTLLVDSRRLGITPSWFLVNVDARLMPLYGRTAETSVIAELHGRMRKGDLDDSRIGSIVEGIVGRLTIDDPRWKSAGPLLIWAWTARKIDPATVANSDVLWPDHSINTDVFASVERIPLVVRQSTRWPTSLVGVRSGLALELRLLDVRIDGISAPDVAGSFDINWPKTAMQTMRRGRELTELDVDADLEPGEYHIEVDIAARLKDTRPKGGNDVVIGSRRHTLRDRMTLRAPAKPLRDAAMCERWRSDLEASSWVRTPTGVKDRAVAYLAVKSTSPIPPGRLSVDLPDDSNWRISSTYSTRWDHEQAQRSPRADGRGMMVNVLATVYLDNPTDIDRSEESIRLRISSSLPNGPGGPHPAPSNDERVFMDCSFEIDVPVLEDRP